MRGRTAADMVMGGDASTGYNMDTMEFSEDMDFVNPADAKAKLAAQNAGAGAGAGAAGGGGGTAALIALQLYGAAKKAQFADKKAKYEAQLDHRNRMSGALDGLINTTRNLRL